MLKKMAALLCALLMAFAVAAAETTALPTPDYTAELEDFLGSWNVRQGYMGGEWITPPTGGAGVVIIIEGTIFLLSNDIVDESYSCTYEDGQIVFYPDGNTVKMFFDADGVLYMHYPDMDVYLSFDPDPTWGTEEADSGLVTPDYTTDLDDFIGTWAVYQGYVGGEWIDPLVDGAGVCISEDEIAFLTEGVVDFTCAYTYEDGQLLCSDGDADIVVFFGADGVLYMYYPDDDMYISFSPDPAAEASDENPFVGEWDGAIVIMFGTPLLPSDLGFDIGMIVTETEANATNAGEVMSTETYVIEDGKAYLSDDVTIMFFDEYGLLHVQSEQLDVICVPAERGIELPE